MGIGPFGWRNSSCNCENKNNLYFSTPAPIVNVKVSTFPNPDPYKFEILRREKIGNFVIAKIHYVGCTNYEGIKILVYNDCIIADIIKSKQLDPHFCEQCKLSPIARFEPTDRGWDWAVSFCKNQSCQ
jgi:hypothetical protein